MPKTYSKLTIIIHWLSALLIIGMMGTGMIGSKLATDAPLRLNLIKLHGTVGLIVLVLTAFRLVILFTSKHPEKLAMPAWRQQMFAWNHRIIYAVIIGLTLSGIGMLITSSIGIAPFNITPDAIVDSVPRTVHGILPKLFLVLLIMHVAGVIHYQIKEGKTFARMGINRN
ncbi:MAG TPA: hypothetical protein ENK21_05285 [Trueperaceae bacterium]|nr:hypothetical protein [Trueperaceae bacterium]